MGKNHTPALSKPISKMNTKEKAAMVTEAKSEIPDLLAAVGVLHERMLRIGTPEAVEYAGVIERQVGVLYRVFDVNHEKVGR